MIDQCTIQSRKAINIAVMLKTVNKNKVWRTDTSHKRIVTSMADPLIADVEINSVKDRHAQNVC